MQSFDTEMNGKKHSYLTAQPEAVPRYWLVYGLGILLLLGGIWMSMKAGQRADQMLRKEIAFSAARVADAINPERVRALSFTPEDAGNPAYQRLCDQMKSFARATGLRSLYSMALRDGKILFGPESLDRGDPYASAPGTVYENPTPADFEIFKTGQASVQGPRSDEYGSFVSALAPVIDPLTGEVLMVVGIDVETPLWRAKVRQARLIPIEVTLLLLVVIASATLAFRTRQRYTTRRYPVLMHIETIACALLMLTATGIVAAFVHHAERDARNESFRILSQAKSAESLDAFSYLRDELDMLGSFFKSSDYVSRPEFREYCKPLPRAGIIQACIWLPAVPEPETEQVISEARADGLPDFSIWQYGDDGIPAPAGGRDIYYPVLYIEPQAGHEKALGYDAGSESNRAHAIEEALRTGLPTATGPVTLFALPNSPVGFHIYQSVSNPSQKGVVGITVHANGFMARNAPRSGSADDLLCCSLFLLSPDRPPHHLASSLQSSAPHNWLDLCNRPHVSIPIFAFGQAYVLMICPENAWLAKYPQRGGIMALIAGLLLTALLTALVAIISSRQTGLEKAIQERSAELVESERRFSGLFRHMSAGFALHEMIFDPKGRPCDYRFLEVNPAFENLTGLNAKDIIGKTVLEVLPKTEPEWIDRYGRVVLTGRPEQFEMQAASLNKLFSVTAYSPAPGQFATIFEDITEHHRIEESMRQLQGIVTDSPVIAYRLRAEPGWPVDYISENIRFFGYAPEDFYSGRMDIVKMILPEDMERVGPEMEAASRNPEVKKLVQVYRIRTKDGRIRWVRDNTRFSRDADGRIISYNGVGLDITEQHETEIQMERLQKIIINSPAVAFLWRAEPGWPVEYVSENVRQFGYAPEDFYEGRIAYSDMVDPADLPRVIEEVTRYSSDPSTKEYVQQYGLRTKDGRTRWVRDATRLRRDESGKITHYEGVILDITEQHMAELALAESRKQLEELLKERTEQLKISNEAKKRFLSTMSHELHTPLNAIMGFSEALQEEVYGKLETGQLEPVEHIRESARRLNSLIDDLISITRIEGGVMPFNPEPLSIRQVLEESVLLLQAAARNRKQKLTADFHSVPDRLRIKADLVKIKQIVHHLISNAIKFTQEGGQIELKGGLADGREFGITGQCLRVSVKDNGRGLEPEEMARVFDLFYQTDSTLARAHGGTGLGLAIVQEFIRLHKGRIWTESGGPGRGSIFTFVIPAEPCEPA